MASSWKGGLLFFAICCIGFQSALSRSTPKSHDEESKSVTLKPKSIAGEYLVFGWGPGQDFVNDYPEYLGFASIQKIGDTWQMIQTEGQKVSGLAKESSHAVGSTTENLVSFGWVSEGNHQNEISKHGSAEYRRVNDDILIGPWSQYGNGNAGFEELVRFTSVEGYYVDLHTKFQKSIRKKVTSTYAPDQVENARYSVHGWEDETKRHSIPDYRGIATAQRIGSTVHFTVEIPDDVELAVGIPRSDGGITLGWWSPKGTWGSANLSKDGQILQGAWTTHDSPASRYQRFLSSSATQLQ